MNFWSIKSAITSSLAMTTMARMRGKKNVGCPIIPAPATRSISHPRKSLIIVSSFAFLYFKYGGDFI